MAVGQEGVPLFKLAATPDRISEAKRLFNENGDAARKILGELRLLAASEDERKAVSQLDSLLSVWISRYADLVRRADSGDPAAVTDFLMREMWPLYIDAGQDCARLLSLADEALLQDRRSAQQIVGTSWWITIALVLAGAITGAMSILVVRSVRREISYVAGKITRGSEQVASASQQVASSSQSLAQGTSEQAATLEQTSASTSEITAIIRKNAENTRSVASLMAKTSTLVDLANRNLAGMVESMKEINGSSERIARIIRE
jgi:methyl-accepting chemotaxis protein/methyl-accepting chemotaxis protein-1 (serine sensor receptor)